MTILELLFFALYTIDTILSVYSINIGLTEKNYLLSFILDYFGMAGYLIVKGLLGCLIVYYFILYSESLIILLVIYILVILNTLIKLRMRYLNDLSRNT